MPRLQVSCACMLRDHPPLISHAYEPVHFISYHTEALRNYNFLDPLPETSRSQLKPVEVGSGPKGIEYSTVSQSFGDPCTVVETGKDLQTAPKEMQSSQENCISSGFHPNSDGTKDRSAKQVRNTKSLASSYVKVALFGVGAHLITVAYWVLSSLTTSYNADLGSFSLSALYVSNISSFFLAPSLVNILGSKPCALLSGLCAFVFASSYFYPSWYTIMPSSIVLGFAAAVLYTALVVTKNDEVRRIVEEKKVDEVTYHGRFSAVSVVACNSSAIVAGIITVASLSVHHDDWDYYNATSLGENGSVYYNTTLEMILQACVKISPTIAAASANTINYYILVAVCTLATLLSVVVFSIAQGAAYHQCKVCSFGMKSALRDIAVYAARVLKQATTPAYGMTLPLWLLLGLITAYFFGVFTKVRSCCSALSCNALSSPQTVTTCDLMLVLHPY